MPARVAGHRYPPGWLVWLCIAVLCVGFWVGALTLIGVW